MDTRKRKNQFTSLGQRVAVSALITGIEFQRLAESIQRSRQSFWLRLIGERRWQEGELEKVAALLGVTREFLIGDGIRDD